MSKTQNKNESSTEILLTSSEEIELVHSLFNRAVDIANATEAIKAETAVVGNVVTIRITGLVQNDNA